MNTIIDLFDILVAVFPAFVLFLVGFGVYTCVNFNQSSIYRIALISCIFISYMFFMFACSFFINENISFSLVSALGSAAFTVNIFLFDSQHNKIKAQVEPQQTDPIV